MSNVSNFYAQDADGDFVVVQESSTPEKGFGFIDTARDGAYLTREHAVGIISALTDLVQAHDEAEAAKAAAKLKAGETVYGNVTGQKCTVTSDETEEGRVDLVRLGSGRLHRGVKASAYKRRVEDTFAASQYR